MEIIEAQKYGSVTSYLFEDDISIDIDRRSRDIVDMDGCMVAPESKLKKIEDRENFKINR